ncbi:hypothetical protein Drorol1_Dr00012169, partial [Drosera rotundifolia]
MPSCKLPYSTPSCGPIRCGRGAAPGLVGHAELWPNMPRPGRVAHCFIKPGCSKSQTGPGRGMDQAGELGDWASSRALDSCRGAITCQAAVRLGCQSLVEGELLVFGVRGVRLE